jgi:Holliday junction resolvase
MSRERGFEFEKEFVNMARVRGCKAWRVGGHKAHDAVVSTKRVQCKDRVYDDRGRVRIARGQNKYRVGDWDVLALRWGGNLYLIPERLLRTKNRTILTVIRPSHFRGWIDAWHVFDGAPTPVEQMFLFQLEEATDGR